jgi:hypothetical protein
MEFLGENGVPPNNEYLDSSVKQKVKSGHRRLPRR